MRKKLANLISITIVFCTLFAMSCSKTTEVGLDILDQDQVGVNVTDTFKVESITIRKDSVINPSYKIFTLTFPSGNFTDPVFGKTTASLYFQMIPGANYSTKKLNAAIVDSVVMSLKYDSLSFGDITTPRSVELYRMTEEMPNQDQYSDKKFTVEATPLTSKTFIARTKPSKDKVKVISYADDTTKISLDPHLRMKLPNTLGAEILKLDSAILNKDAEFTKVIKGFYLKPTSDDKGMINFLLTQYTSSSASYNTATNINIYYRDNDGKKNIMSLYSGVTSVKSVNFAITPSKLLASTINNKAAGDSVVYVQGMNGTDVKLSIPKIKNLYNKNLIVNKATLEMYLKPTADGFIAPPQLVLRKKNIGSVYDDLIPDVIFANNASTALSAFGGKPEKVTINGEALIKYTFNMSNYAQRIIDEPNTSETFYLAFENKSSTINRGVFYGAKHPKYPMKFKLYYTKI
jgi:hypothetical protein